MPDRFPEPDNRINEAVFGADVGYHPITRLPLQRGSGALSISEQARGHLKVIARHHGIEHARAIARKPIEFEQTGGEIKMPAAIIPREFRFGR